MEGSTIFLLKLIVTPKLQFSGALEDFEKVAVSPQVTDSPLFK